MSETSNRAPRSGSGTSLLEALFRNLMSIFFVGVSVMCVYNVFGVGPEVEVLAKETACQGQPLPCTAQYTQGLRTPWSHTFKMYTSATSGEKAVDCRREYILVGDYSCKIYGKASADTAPVVATSAVVATASASAKAATTNAPARFSPKVKVTATPIYSAAPPTQ